MLPVWRLERLDAYPRHVFRILSYLLYMESNSEASGNEGATMRYGSHVSSHRMNGAVIFYYFLTRRVFYRCPAYNAKLAARKYCEVKCPERAANQRSDNIESSKAMSRHSSIKQLFGSKIEEPFLSLRSSNAADSILRYALRSSGIVIQRVNSRSNSFCPSLSPCRSS